MTRAAAVGFDFDRTLGVDNGLETVALYRLAGELGRAVDEHDTAAAAKVGELLGRFRLGSMSLDDAVAHFIAWLRLPPPADAGVRYRTLCYGLVDELVTPIAGARDIIAELDANAIPHAILTNGWSPLQSYKIARAIDYRGPVLVSDRLGVLKPDPAAFGHLVAALGVAPHDVWYVGDNPRTDIFGAQNAGLHAIWFDWENNPYPADAPPPERRIGRLSELLDVVRGVDGPTQNRRW